MNPVKKLVIHNRPKLLPKRAFSQPSVQKLKSVMVNPIPKGARLGQNPAQQQAEGNQMKDEQRFEVPALAP